MKLFRAALLSAAGLALAAAGAPASIPMPLKGGGVEATLDLQGFKQDEGVKNFNGSYFRLGQYSADEALSKQLGHPFNVSVLVDDAPDNVKGNPFLLGFGAAKNAMAAMAGPAALAGNTMTMQRLDAAKGMLLWYSEQHSIQDRKLCMLHIYFETLQAGKWVELHFSAPSEQPLADPAALLAKAKALAATLKIQAEAAPTPASSPNK